MGINSLFSLVKKDLKILGRSKFSSLMILLTPLLIILLAGAAFNSSGLNGIVLGVYSDSYTELNENILNNLENNNFAIEKFDLEEDCMNSVKLNKAQICIVFSNELNSTENIEKIIFHVDHSRINLAHSLVYYIENEIDSTSSNISISLTQNLIDNLELVKTSVALEKTKLSSAIVDVNGLSENIEDLSSNPNIDLAINSLNDAKDLMNASVSKDKITETISVLEEINNFNLESSGDLVEQNNGIISALNDVSKKLDEIIISLENGNSLSSEEIASPVNIEINSLNVSSSNRDYLLPTLLTLIALFGGILLSSTLVLKERKAKAFFRNFMTPTWDFTFIFSCYITCLIILITQFILVFVGIEYLLKISIFGILPEIGLILFLALTLFIFLGMFIGYLFKSEESTIFASVIIAAALMFLSNTLLPIESISSGFKLIADFNPVVILDLALKKVTLFGFSYSEICEELITLASFSLVFLFLAYLGRKITRRML